MQQNWLMELLSLNRGLIEQRIQEKFGKKGNFERQTKINRATLMRWYEGTSHPRPESFLTLAGALDLDFVSLLDISAGRLTLFLPDLMRIVICGGWKEQLPTLAFVVGLLYPRKD